MKNDKSSENYMIRWFGKYDFRLILEKRRHIQLVSLCKGPDQVTRHRHGRGNALAGMTLSKAKMRVESIMCSVNRVSTHQIILKYVGSTVSRHDMGVGRQQTMVLLGRQPTSVLDKVSMRKSHGLVKCGKIEMKKIESLYIDNKMQQ